MKINLKYMKTAKIVSFIALISNSCLLIYSLIGFSRLLTIFKDLQMPTPFPWTVLVALIFAIGSLVYWFYLRNKEKEGKNVKFALWISIALLVIPAFIIILISALTITQPIYEQLKTI